jgi:hypothetical protein
MVCTNSAHRRCGAGSPAPSLWGEGQQGLPSPIAVADWPTFPMPGALFFPRGTPFFLSFTRPPPQSTHHYLQPPIVVPICVSGHCAPQPRFSYATAWGAYDMWVFQGSRSWPQGRVVHRSYVLLVCRKFWIFVHGCGPGAAVEAAAGQAPSRLQSRHHAVREGQVLEREEVINQVFLLEKVHNIRAHPQRVHRRGAAAPVPRRHS